MYYGAQVSEFEVKSFSLRFLAALVAHLAGLCGYDSHLEAPWGKSGF